MWILPHALAFHPSIGAWHSILHTCFAIRYFSILHNLSPSIHITRTDSRFFRFHSFFSPSLFWIFRATAASGPVRLFTPYKRRRRNQISIETTNDIQSKQKKSSDDENIIVQHDQGIVTKEETTWQSIADGIETAGEYIDSTSSMCDSCVCISIENKQLNTVVSIQFIDFCWKLQLSLKPVCHSIVWRRYVPKWPKRRKIFASIWAKWKICMQGKLNVCKGNVMPH